MSLDFCSNQGACCRIVNAYTDVGSWKELYYSNCIIGGLFLLQFAYLCFRLNKSFGSRSGDEILRVYHAYSLLLAVWLVLSIVLLLIPDSILSIVLQRCLYGGHALLDNFVILLACFDFNGKYSIIKAFVLTLCLTALKVGLMFNYTFLENCGFCPIFYPAPEATWTDLAYFAIYLLFILLLLIKRPKIRQSIKKWVIFLCAIYCNSFISTMLIAKGFDIGFCTNAVSVVFYSGLYSPLLFITFVEDTREVKGQYDISQTFSRESNPLLYYGNKLKFHKQSIKLIPYEELTVGPKIGIGGYGEVYRGRWHHSNVAIKRVFQKVPSEEEGQVDDFLKEIEIMSKLTHPNIVLFIGASVTNTGVFIITEFMPRGSVYSIIHNKANKKGAEKPLSMKKKLNMLLDAAKGMVYLHTFDPPIIHRDLKTQNLLVDINWKVKLCDFGLSRMIAQETMSRLGTLQYSAPEILRGEKYDEKADIFSFGVIIWEVFSEAIPFDGWPPIKVASDVAYHGRRLTVTDDTPEEVKSIVESCWENTAIERPDFKSLIVSLKSVIKKSAQFKEYEEKKPKIDNNSNDVYSSANLSINFVEEKKHREDIKESSSSSP